MTTPETTSSDDQWGAHSAWDAMDTPPDVTGVGGDDWEDLANQ